MAKMKRWIDFKFLGLGLGIVALACLGIVAWLAIAGPLPEAPPTPSVSVTVQTEEATPPPAAVPPPIDETKLQPPPQAAVAPALPPNAESTKGAAAPAMPAVNTSDKRPKIAIIVTEIGVAKDAAPAAQKLPAAVTLAFLPFGDVAGTVAAARDAGHETLLDLPMEPSTYPDDNPGADALMIGVGDMENLHRLNAMLAKESGIVGVVTYMGSRFSAAEARLKPIIEALATHNLFIVDNRSNQLSTISSVARDAKLPFAVADLQIDADPSRDAIDANLAKLEEIAKQKGSAIGLTATYPLTFDRLSVWTEGLAAKGIVLVPISAVVTRP